MKKLFSTIALGAATLTACAAVALTTTSCGNDTKIGFIFLHDENSSYDKNFIEAAKDVCEELGVTPVMKTGIDESAACKDAAQELVDEGCKGVFADSFGHEQYMLEAAKANPDVQFAHATGTKAHTAGQANYHNAFSSIYEGRYLAGVVAGLKVQSMIDSGAITESQAIMGYVGAYPYAEVVSGYTSFFLGARSVCPSVTMTVRYTNSWYSVDGEATACRALIDDDKAVLISQHADSQGAPGVCEEKSVPNVFYNGTNSTLNTYLTASRVNWRPYFRYFIQSVIDGKEMPSDYIGSMSNGDVELLDTNTNLAAAGTAEKVAEVKAKLENGSLKVFDATTFTYNGGKTLTSYLADVDDDGTYVGETEVVEEYTAADGSTHKYFNESATGKRSAPYFDLRIDGITEK